MHGGALLCFQLPSGGNFATSQILTYEVVHLLRKIGLKGCTLYLYFLFGILFLFDKYTMTRQCIFHGKVARSGCTLHIDLNPFCSSLSFLNFFLVMLYFSALFIRF